MNTRRQFLITAPLGVLAATSGCGSPAPSPSAPAPASPASTPGAPPTFATGPVTGPPVSAATFAEAEKLVQVTMRPADRELAASSWQRSLAPLLERRTGPRKVALEADTAPATIWTPSLIDTHPAPTRDAFVRSRATATPLPASDADIAFAPVTELSRWIEQRQLTSDRLTRIYLQRIDALDSKLLSVITKTADHALAQAKQADAEIAAGRYRGPLHGIPYGVKDLLDTGGIATTYGAEPFRTRVPAADSAVVRRLTEAGAVLVAKLSLGALALNDIWFGGQTMNPWLLEEGASGSSAGPGAATAAALVGFSIGSETGGSIIAPSMRCGVTGLRPTFGRVPRTGAMALCWSLDKLGPMTRSVEDAMLVLQAITGPDPGDVSSVPCHLDFDATAPVDGLRVGYFPNWMNESPATDVDRAALELVKKLGMTAKEVSLPNWPYGSLMHVLFSEAAAAFEELTLSNGVDAMKVQVPDALAEPVPAVAVSLRRGLRAGRPAAPPRRRRDGPDLRRGGPVARAVTARRDAHDRQLHRPSVHHTPRRLRAGVAGAQRLGAGSGEPAADVRTAPAGASRRDAHRAAVRRGDDRPCGRGDGACVGRGGRTPRGILIGRRDIRDHSGRPCAISHAASRRGLPASCSA